MKNALNSQCKYASTLLSSNVIAAFFLLMSNIAIQPSDNLTIKTAKAANFHEI